MESEMNPRNLALVENLIKEGILKNPKSISAIKSIDRKDFTPAHIKGSNAYEDTYTVID